MRLFGSFAVFLLVSLRFIPDIRAQNESRRLPPSGCGGFKFIPCFLADALPLAFKPPAGVLPSLRCHAGDLAMIFTLYFTVSPVAGDGTFGSEDSTLQASFDCAETLPSASCVCTVQQIDPPVVLVNVKLEV